MVMEGATKESTLLSHSQTLLKQVFELEALLNNRFNRNLPEEGKTEAKPRQDDVLDEIADNLEQVSAKLTETISFLSSFVLPKIN